MYWWGMTAKYRIHGQIKNANISFETHSGAFAPTGMAGCVRSSRHIFFAFTRGEGKRGIAAAEGEFSSIMFPTAGRPKFPALGDGNGLRS